MIGFHMRTILAVLLDASLTTDIRDKGEAGLCGNIYTVRKNVFHVRFISDKIPQKPIVFEARSDGCGGVFWREMPLVSYDPIMHFWPDCMVARLRGIVLQGAACVRGAPRPMTIIRAGNVTVGMALSANLPDEIFVRGERVYISIPRGSGMMAVADGGVTLPYFPDKKMQPDITVLWPGQPEWIVDTSFVHSREKIIQKVQQKIKRQSAEIASSIFKGICDGDITDTDSGIALR